MNYLKAGGPYLACLILGLLWAQSCASGKTSKEHEAVLLAQVKQETDSVQMFAARDTVTLAHIIDTVPKLIWKIRTVVLSPVDSSWKIADSLIQLAPASDSACHLAYDGLKSGCQKLREQVVADTLTFRWIRDSAQLVKEREVKQAVLAATASSKTDTLAKVKGCKILFVKCPSRTLSFILGDAAGIAAVLFLHH